jgi:hypothetical protein
MRNFFNRGRAGRSVGRSEKNGSRRQARQLQLFLVSFKQQQQQHLVKNFFPFSSPPLHLI